MKLTATIPLTSSVIRTNQTGQWQHSQEDLVLSQLLKPSVTSATSPPLYFRLINKTVFFPEKFEKGVCQFHLGFPIILRIIGTLLVQLAGGGGGEEQTTWTFKIGVVSRSSTKLPIM